LKSGEIDSSVQRVSPGVHVKNQLEMERRRTMKKGLILAAMFVFSQVISFAGQGSKVEQEIRKLDDQRIAALTQPDFAVLDRMMTDDFTYTHSSGQVQTKAEFLGDFKAGRRVFKSVKEEGIQVRDYGNVAVVTGQCTLIGTNAGKDFILPMRFVEVYSRANGNWQWVMWQSTKLPS
jgi:ketosteroid isomerase-like protein